MKEISRDFTSKYLPKIIPLSYAAGKKAQPTPRVRIAYTECDKTVRAGNGVGQYHNTGRLKKVNNSLLS